MNIQNNTLYDKDLLERYYRYYLKDFILKNFSIMGIVTIAGAIYLFTQGEWQTALIFLGFILVYLAITVIIQKMSSNRAVKKSPLVEHPVMRNFTFTDDLITISGVQPKEIKYQEITKVNFSKEFLILYDNTRKVYIVDLTKFTNIQDISNLKTLIGSKLFKKFK
jgi:ABC-type multidrug transport system fused ATPase/permease subunit